METLLRWIWLCLAFSIAVSLSGQPKSRIPPAQQLPDFLNAEQALAFQESFQRSSYAEPQVWAFFLEYRPFRQPTVSYTGKLAVDWKSWGRRVRIDLQGEESRTDLSIVSGKSPWLDWKLNGEDVPIDSVESVWDQPIADALPIHLRDLGMPFLYEETWLYLGPDRRLGRPCQVFLVRASHDESISYRLTIDEDFLALLRVETMSMEESEVLQRWEISRLKKVGDTWVVRQIQYLDSRKKEKAILTITHILEPEGGAAGIFWETGEAIVGENSEWIPVQ